MADAVMSETTGERGGGTGGNAPEHHRANFMPIAIRS
jgi:hypothetical protein